jgi:hypothetical protein
MTDPRDPHTDELDELISAYLDGEVTPEERARVEEDPQLLARVDELRSVVDLWAQDLPCPTDAERDAVLAVALAGVTAAAADDGRTPTSLTTVRAGRTRWARPAALVASAVAVVVLAGGAVSMIAGGGDGGGDDLAATASARAEVDASARAEIDATGAGDDAPSAAGTASVAAAQEEARSASDAGGESAPASGAANAVWLGSFDSVDAVRAAARAVPAAGPAHAPPGDLTTTTGPTPLRPESPPACPQVPGRPVARAVLGDRDVIVLADADDLTVVDASSCDVLGAGAR